MHGYVVEGPGHFDEVVHGDGLESVAISWSVLATFAHYVLESFKFGYCRLVVNHRKPWGDNQNYDDKNQQKLC